eukprot:scaffold4002_cov123-Isochrysis_galbana.AAC.2
MFTIFIHSDSPPSARGGSATLPSAPYSGAPSQRPSARPDASIPTALPCTHRPRACMASLTGCSAASHARPNSAIVSMPMIYLAVSTPAAVTPKLSAVPQPSARTAARIACASASMVGFFPPSFSISSTAALVSNVRMPSATPPARDRVEMAA